MKPIISRLAYNCKIQLQSYVGTNGMGENIYRTTVSCPAHYTVKSVRVKKDGEIHYTSEYTITTPNKNISIGDVLLIDNKWRVIVQQVVPGDIYEVIAHDENPNSF